MARKKAVNLNLLYQKAQQAEGKGDLAAAEKYYREALSNQQNLGTWGVLSWLLFSKGAFKEALEAAKKMRNLALKNKSRRMMALSSCLTGLIHQAAGRKALAERFYREALEAKPRSETNVFLGSLLEELGRSSEAKLCYQKALEIDPGNYEAHFNLGKWYKAHGDYDRAIKYLRRAIDLSGNFPAAVSQLAIVMWQYGYTGFKLAKELLEEALVKNIADTENHLLLGFTYKLLGKKKDAEQQFRFAAEQLEPNTCAFIALACFLANDMNEDAEAEANFKKAIDLEPENELPHYYYGKFLLDRGEAEKGKEHLAQANRS